MDERMSNDKRFILWDFSANINKKSQIFQILKILYFLEKKMDIFLKWNKKFKVSIPENDPGFWDFVFDYCETFLYRKAFNFWTMVWCKIYSEKMKLNLQ